jgi:hypothetical protein
LLLLLLLLLRRRLFIIRLLLLLYDARTWTIDTRMSLAVVRTHLFGMSIVLVLHSKPHQGFTATRTTGWHGNNQPEIQQLHALHQH